MAAVRGRKGGKGGGGSGGSEAKNTLQSQATARLVEIISHGECVGLANRTRPLRSIFFDGVAVENSDNSYNFKGLQVQERTGTPNQLPFQGFPSVEAISSINLPITIPNPRTYSVTASNVDAVRVTIQIDALAKQDDNGNLVGNRVEFRLERRIAAGSWSTVSTIKLNEKCTSPQQLSYRIERPSAAGPTDDWDVRVTRVTADSVKVSDQSAISLSSVTELTDAKIAYADSAGVAMTVDSKQFGNSIPVRSYDWVGMVLDVPSNYTPPSYTDPNDPTKRVYTGLWDGTFKRAWTDNPAWVLWAMLTDRDWGLGDAINPDQIDKWALYRIAQYCDEFIPDGFGDTEPRYTFNTQITSAEEAYAILQSVASVFRGGIYWGSGMVTFVADMPSDPVKLVSPANVVGGEFNYQGAPLKTRHSVAKITWNDPSDQYKPAIEVVEDPVMMERYGWRDTEAVAYGCTSRGQAHRLGKWILDTERYSVETVSYQASLDHADVRPGDIVQVYDPHYAGVRLAGRLTAIAGTSATVDAPVEIESGKTYELSFVRSDGTLTTRTLTNSPATTSTLNWTDTLIEQPAVSSTVEILQTTLPTQKSRIASVTTTTVTLNSGMVIDGTYAYTLYFNMADGSVVTRTITNPGDGEYLTLSWSGALSVLPPVGSVVYLAVPAQGYTSRTVDSRTHTSVTVSASVTFDDDHSYEIQMTLPSGTVITRRLTNAPGTTTTLTWDADETTNALPLVGSMWGLTVSDLAPRLFRVVGLKEIEPNLFEVTALLHDETKYDRIELGLELDPTPTSIYQSEEVPAAPTAVDAYRVPRVNADGTYAERILIKWTPSTSTLVNRYRVRYLYQDQWYDLGETYGDNIDVESHGAGIYLVQIIAVNFMGRESLPLEETLELEDVRPFDSPLVTNIRIEDTADVTQPADVEFTGSDLKLVWGALPPDDWYNQDLEDWEDPYLKRYRIQLKTTADAVVGTFYTTDRRFLLTKEMNAEANGGTPLRQFKIGVAFEDHYGTVHTESVQQFSNPAPAAPTIAVTATARGFVLDVSLCQDSDYGGTKIWVSTTNGFDPLVVSPVNDAPQTSFTVAATSGTTYYVRAAHYDDYSTAPADLNRSTQYSIAVPTLGTVDIEVGSITSDLLDTGESIGVPTGLDVSSAITYDTDGTQIVLMTSSWTAPAGATNLQHYELRIQEDGGAALVIPVTSTDYVAVVKASTDYDVQVRSVSYTGARSSYTSIVPHTSTSDTTAPSAPTGLAVTASLTALHLTWTNPSAVDLHHVELWENTINAVGGTQIATIMATPSAGGSWTRAGLGAGVTRYYSLKAVDTSGNASGYTSVASGTVSTITFDTIDTTAPAVPAGLNVSSALTLDTDSTQIITLIVTWSAVGDADLSFYELAIQEGAGAFVEFNVGQGTRFERTVKANTSYTAKIRAVDETQNRSAYSSTVNHTTTLDTTAPSAPTSPAATAAFNAIFLSWTCPTAADLAKIEVWENTTNNSGTATRIATVNAISSAVGGFTRSGLASGVQRYYWFKAVDTSGNTSGFSSGVNATTSKVVATDFSTGVTPIEYGDAGAAGGSLPSSGNYEGRYYFNTNASDRKLYRYAGGAWTKAVDGTDITVNTITGSKIIAGEISTSHIAANAISASKLFVGDVSNAFIDSNMSECATTGGGYTFTADVTRVAGTVLSTTVASTYAASFAVNGSSYNFYCPPYIVEANKPYYISAYLEFVGTTGTGRFFLTWFSDDAAADFITQEDLTGSISTTGRVSVMRTAPATARTLRLRFIRNGGGDRIMYVAEPIIRRASNGELIVDGSIITQHMTANTINGDRITAGTLYANKLFVSGNSTQDALPTGITIGVSGTTIGTVDTRASDPVTRANTQSTKLLPGLVEISGATTLSDWRQGGDLTKIAGGSISANTVSANKLNVGVRGVDMSDIYFTANWNGTTNTTNTVHWTNGTIFYVDDAGTATSVATSGGSAAWTTGTIYVYWVKGASSLSTTTTIGTAYGTNNIVLATYVGGTRLVVTYGKTIVDGTQITTGTITANAISAGAITADKILVGVTGGDNFLLNGGGETAGTDGWLHVNSTGTTSLAAVTAEKYAGDYSFRLQKDATSSAAYAHARAVAINSNKRYTIRIAAKAGVSASSGFYIRVYERSTYPSDGFVTDANDTSLQDLVSNGPIGTSWTLYEYQYTPTAGTQWASLTVINWTNGPVNMYFDEAQLTEQASGVMIKDGAVTATKISVANLAAITADVGMINAGGITVNDGTGNGEPVFSINNGEVFITSARVKALSSGSIITVGSGTGVKVALQSFKITAKDGDAVTWPTDLGNVPTYQQPIPSNTLVALSAGETYNLYLENITATGATVRLKKISGGSSAAYSRPSSGVGTLVGDRYEIAKTDASDTNTGTYSFRVKGTHGYVKASEGKGYNITYRGSEVEMWFYNGTSWTMGPILTMIGPDPGSPVVGTVYTVNYDITTSVDWNNAMGASGKFGVRLSDADEIFLNDYFNNGGDGNGTAENTITEFTKVTWTGNSGVTTSTASPSNETTTITIIPQNV